MPAVNGYVDQAKTGENQFATVGPVREGQHALDVLAHTFFQEIGTDAAEAGSTTTEVVATGHAALVGDRISWIDGNLQTREYAVLAVAANAITTEPMSEAPAAADQFKILRPKAPVVDAQGQLSVGVSFSSDIGYGAPNTETNRVAAMLGVGTAAVSDANPVPIKDPDGVLATEATLGGVATDVATVAGAVSGTEMQVDVVSSALPTGAATEAKQDTGNTALAAIQAAVEGTLAVQATNLDIRDLTSASDSVAAAQSGAWSVDLDAGAQVDVANLPTTVDTNAGAPGNSTPRVAVAAANIAYTAKGKISGASLTGTYATLLNPTSDLRMLYFFNSCDATILVSLDGGTTDSFELEAGESFSIDFAANGLKFDNAVNISAKHGGAAPTTGTIRVSGVG